MFACLTLLVTGCGSAKAGSPVPNGAEAAKYVSAKFSATLDKLGNQFSGTDAKKSVQDTFARFDQQKINSTVSAVQLGRPPSRLSRNHSNLDSNEFLDTFHPANSPVEYMLLGPVYASLAPTHWVSMPYTGGDLNECFWAGSQGLCKMLSTVSDAVDHGRAKTARSAPDGSLELTTDVTLGSFLDNRVVVFPQSILDKITPAMKAQTLAARLVLDAKGRLTEIRLSGLVRGSGHEVELNEHYRLDGTPTENDLPKVPDPADVTVLPDSAAVSDFYARMREIQGR
ncbi:hypothetical protein FG385_05615 [Amycolatopsis alkalitolerans]|uniref:LppX_LprAFG lipoprotein n=1 Tax=Amycolatopsis alkalitolerans TaxID=2547244 RepID=A0A5C4M6B0_9PSEU|nr:hypothetical protein FG385_05615 [Amycolatopsis alkalitolerans]